MKPLTKRLCFKSREAWLNEVPQRGSKNQETTGFSRVVIEFQPSLLLTSLGRS